MFSLVAAVSIVTGNLFQQNLRLSDLRRSLFSLNTDGQPWVEKNDKRFLSDLLELWYTEHGKSLRDGERRKRDLDVLCNEMRSPRAVKAVSEFQRWCSVRIGTRSPVTLNLKHAYLKAVFGELVRLGHWRQEQGKGFGAVSLKAVVRIPSDYGCAVHRTFVGMVQVPRGAEDQSSLGLHEVLLALLGALDGLGLAYRSATTIPRRCRIGILHSWESNRRH